MKKKYTIVVAIILTLLLCGSIYWTIKNNSNLLAEEIYLDYWNDPYARHMVCRANVDGEVTTSYMDCTAAFFSKTDKQAMIDTNKKDYVGEITYWMYGNEIEASLLYADNNYFILYYDEENGYYRIENCYLDYGVDNMMIYVPSPVHLVIDEESFEFCYEDGKNMLDYLFDYCSFEEAKEFYRRISEEYVSIDDEMERITVDGYDVREEKIIEKCLILDFKNRTVEGKDKKGNYILMDGK